MSGRPHLGPCNSVLLARNQCSTCPGGASETSTRFSRERLSLRSQSLSRLVGDSLSRPLKVGRATSEHGMCSIAASICKPVVTGKERRHEPRGAGERGEDPDRATRRPDKSFVV